MRPWLGDVARWERVAWAALVLLALGLRLTDLGARPFHHDESQDAYFSFVHRFEYDPLLHGPLRFYLTAATYALLGASDFTARLVPALMGTVVVALPLLLRRTLGRGGALVAAALFAVGPSYLYFSRFAREDIYVAAITLAMLVVLLRFLDRPQAHHPALLGALLAASFATKETTFITVFVAGTFYVPLALVQIRRHGVRGAPLLRAVASLGWMPWVWGLASFALVFTLLFTVLFTWPAGLWAGLHDGLAYWLGQHGVGRGGEPPGFYVFLLFGDEWPVLLLAAVGVAAVWRAPSTGRWFLVWAFACSLAVYSWAGEKFAWLVLHPLLPLVLLAGIGARALWASRRRLSGRAGLALAAVAALYVGYASYQANVVHPADPREILVSTQSSTQVLGVRDEVRRLDARSGGRLTITVDAADGATFPWAWYFRDLGVGYLDMTQPGAQPTSQVLLLTDPARVRLGPELTAYEGRRFDFRVWWVRDYGGAASPANWARWMVSREPWNPTGGMPLWLFVRRDVV
jgi:uncharacterized protein (TIGR03663 family)